MNNVLKTILKGRNDGDEILRKLAIPVDEEPDAFKKETLEFCVKQINEGKPLEEAAKAAIKWANDQRASGAIATTQTPALSAPAVELPFGEEEQGTLNDVIQAVADGEGLDVNQMIAEEVVGAAAALRKGIRGLSNAVIFEGIRVANRDEAMKRAKALKEDARHE